jgi:hypothetical protein
MTEAPERQLERIEVDIETAKTHIENLNALRRLRKNKDFKNLIEEGYFKEEAARAVLLKSDTEMQSEEEQKNVDNLIWGIGQLFMYFHKVISVGRQMEASMESYENTREEILADQLGEEGV